MLITIYRELGQIHLSSNKKKTLQFAGYCHRADKDIVSSLLLWYPSGSVFPRKLTYPDTVAQDSGLDVRDLGTAIQNEQWGKGLSMEF